jgi:hypothetical protein
VVPTKAMASDAAKAKLLVFIKSLMVSDGFRQD